MLHTLLFTPLTGKDTNILVSSTKDSARQDFTTDGRLFMYGLNNIGPKMDPRGTAWVTVPCSDKDVPRRVDCWRSVK